MAINFEIAEMASTGQAPGGSARAFRQNPGKITNVVAAGATVLQATTKVVTLRNRTGGDAVWAKIQLVAGHTNSTAANATLLSPAQDVTFTLPKSAVGSDYEVDVRTAS